MKKEGSSQFPVKIDPYPELSRFVVLVVDGMSIGQHALMQDARNQNATTLRPIEQDVLAMLMTP